MPTTLSVARAPPPAAVGNGPRETSGRPGRRTPPRSPTSPGAPTATGMRRHPIPPVLAEVQVANSPNTESLAGDFVTEPRIRRGVGARRVQAVSPASSPAHELPAVRALHVMIPPTGSRPRAAQSTTPAGSRRSSADWHRSVAGRGRVPDEPRAPPPHVLARARLRECASPTAYRPPLRSGPALRPRSVRPRRARHAGRRMVRAKPDRASCSCSPGATPVPADDAEPRIRAEYHGRAVPAPGASADTAPAGERSDPYRPD